jgi:hypothetical protein
MSSTKPSFIKPLLDRFDREHVFYQILSSDEKKVEIKAGLYYYNSLNFTYTIESDGIVDFIIEPQTSDTSDFYGLEIRNLRKLGFKIKGIDDNEK